MIINRSTAIEFIISEYEGTTRNFFKKVLLRKNDETIARCIGLKVLRKGFYYN
jgi:hypothetical protein